VAELLHQLVARVDAVGHAKGVGGLVERQQAIDDGLVEDAVEVDVDLGVRLRRRWLRRRLLFHGAVLVTR
jgi:hypothetical protein